MLLSYYEEMKFQIFDYHWLQSIPMMRSKSAVNCKDAHLKLINHLYVSVETNNLYEIFMICKSASVGDSICILVVFLMCSQWKFKTKCMSVFANLSFIHTCSCLKFLCLVGERLLKWTIFFATACSNWIF